MEAYRRLLLSNKAWVKDKLSVRLDYFKRTAKDQRPDFLWIGCADSRVPAEDVTGTEPGELFVHRNIANLVIHTDFNMLSVLHYAVEVLEVKHIIVCGHYGCGGVKAALGNKDFGLINKWLRHVKDTYHLHRAELDLIENDQTKFDRMVEISTIEQVNNLAQMSIIQKSWAAHNRPHLHAWVYDLKTGYIKDIAMIESGSKIEDIYMYDLE